MVSGFPPRARSIYFSAINGLLPLFFVCFSSLRSKEENRWASGSDCAKALGGHPTGRVQTHPRTCGNQAPAPPRQTGNWTSQSNAEYLLTSSYLRAHLSKNTHSIFLIYIHTGKNWDVGGYVSEGYDRTWPRPWHITAETKEVCLSPYVPDSGFSYSWLTRMFSDLFSRQVWAEGDHLEHRWGCPGRRWYLHWREIKRHICARVKAALCFCFFDATSPRHNVPSHAFFL